MQALDKVKGEQRKKIYEEALRREAGRVNSIMLKQIAKDQALAELTKIREHAADVKSLQHQLDLENKRDKVKLTCGSALNTHYYTQRVLMQKIVAEVIWLLTHSAHWSLYSIRTRLNVCIYTIGCSAQNNQAFQI